MSVHYASYKLAINELINQSEDYVCQLDTVKKWLEKYKIYYNENEEYCRVFVQSGIYFPSNAEFHNFYLSLLEVVEVLPYNEVCIEAMNDIHHLELQAWKDKYSAILQKVNIINFRHPTDIDKGTIELSKIPLLNEKLYLKDVNYRAIEDFIDYYYTYII